MLSHPPLDFSPRELSNAGLALDNAEPYVLEHQLPVPSIEPHPAFDTFTAMVQTLTVFEIDPYEFCEEEFDRAEADLSGHFDRHAAPFAVLLRTWDGQFPSESESSTPRGTTLPFTVHDFFRAGHDFTRKMREHGCERNRSGYSPRPAWDRVNEMVKELLRRDILPISFHDDNREFVVVMNDADGMGTAPLLRIVNVEPCPCHPWRSSPHFRWILNSWPRAEYRSPMDLMIYGLGHTETDSDEDDSDEDESAGYDSDLEPDTTDDFNPWMVFRPELSR